MFLQGWSGEEVKVKVDYLRIAGVQAVLRRVDLSLIIQTNTENHD